MRWGTRHARGKAARLSLRSHCRRRHAPMCLQTLCVELPKSEMRQYVQSRGSLMHMSERLQCDCCAQIADTVALQNYYRAGYAIVRQYCVECYVIINPREFELTGKAWQFFMSGAGYTKVLQDLHRRAWAAETALSSVTDQCLALLPRRRVVSALHLCKHMTATRGVTPVCRCQSEVPVEPCVLGSPCRRPRPWPRPAGTIMSRMATSMITSSMPLSL